jgi:hypothetical protein
MLRSVYQKQMFFVFMKSNSVNIAHYLENTRFMTEMYSSKPWNIKGPTRKKTFKWNTSIFRHVKNIVQVHLNDVILQTGMFCMKLGFLNHVNIKTKCAFWMWRHEVW